MRRVTRLYPLKLEQDDNDILLVTCPDLPDFVAFGRDEDDAIRRAAVGIEALASHRLEQGLGMPSPRRRRRGEAVARVRVDVAPALAR